MAGSQPTRQGGSDSRLGGRVADTVTLLSEMLDRQRVDRVVLVAPAWADAQLRRYMPSALAEKVVCNVNIPADAGESTILAMALG